MTDPGPKPSDSLTPDPIQELILEQQELKQKHTELVMARQRLRMHSMVLKGEERREFEDALKDIQKGISKVESKLNELKEEIDSARARQAIARAEEILRTL